MYFVYLKTGDAEGGLCGVALNTYDHKKQNGMSFDTPFCFFMVFHRRYAASAVFSLFSICRYRRADRTSTSARTTTAAINTGE